MKMRLPKSDDSLVTDLSGRNWDSEALNALSLTIEADTFDERDHSEVTYEDLQDVPDFDPGQEADDWEIEFRENAVTEKDF